MKYLAVCALCLICAAWGIYAGYGMALILQLP